MFAPVNFHWDNCFSDQLHCTGNIFWQVHITPQGEWTIEPDLYTIIYDVVDWQIVRYEF